MSLRAVVEITYKHLGIKHKAFHEFKAMMQLRNIMYIILQKEIYLGAEVRED